MRKLLVVFLLALSVLCWAESPGLASVPLNDLLKLQTLLNDTMNYNETVITQSQELQKIINASETELNGLKLNLSQLQNELQNWKSISEAQASEINRLLPLLGEQDKISKRQAELLGVTLHQNKIMRWSLIVGIPAAMGTGTLIAWLLSK